MNTQEILIRLRPVFRRVFNDENLILTEELSAKDVDKWDSLTHMILISEIEREFSIKFKLKDLNHMKNVGDMASLILIKIS